jgi:hypothetical protein
MISDMVIQALVLYYTNCGHKHSTSSLYRRKLVSSFVRNPLFFATLSSSYTEDTRCKSTTTCQCVTILETYRLLLNRQEVYTFAYLNRRNTSSHTQEQRTGKTQVYLLFLNDVL